MEAVSGSVSQGGRVRGRAQQLLETSAMPGSLFCAWCRLIVLTLFGKTSAED